MSLLTADYTFHPPSGSSLPGMTDANIYMTYPPNDLRKLLETEKDVEELKKIESAIKQWERQYSYPGFPWKKNKLADQLRVIASNLIRYGEIPAPAENIPYYQDAETPEGFEGIMEGDKGQYDNDDMVRFDIPRQGIRPDRDIDTSKGDFLSPKDPVVPDAVKPRGDGPDPEIEYPFPPTGGDIDGWPEGI